MPPRRLSYRGIADDLESRIRSGEYAPGARLPSYRELADIYDVSVSTASKAIALLVERGLIYGETGRGTFVEDPLPQ